MNVEENRLRTFANWPANAAVSPERLAKAGFYYSGHELEVQCFLCGTQIFDWNYGDQAVGRHRQAEPNCPFITNPSSTCNVPLVPTPINNIESQSPPSEVLHTNNLSENQSLALFHPTRNPKEEYRKLSQRLSTFINWPITSIVSPEKLAKAGFYYFQDGDMVECAFCGGIVRKWKPGDDPDKVHRKHFPLCDFYMHPDEDAGTLVLSNVKIMPGSTMDLTELGIHKHTAPCQAKHATYEGRLRTFCGWSKDLKQTPEMLSSAGFYYEGEADHVRCFHCDGGLRNWEATDDAWVEHARWFPKCGYVNLVRGQEFIKQCVVSRPPLDPSIFTGTAEEDNSEVTETPPASFSVRLPPTQEITDTVLEQLLHSPPALAALEIGLHVGRVKRVLKRRMEVRGVPYVDPDELIEDVLHEQIMENESRFESQTPDSPDSQNTRFSELINLLDRVTEQSNNGARLSSNTSDNDPPAELKDEKTEPNSSNEKPSEISDNGSTTVEKKSNTQSKETASLEEENRRLKEARLCKICMDREVAVVFLSCGHLATCVLCAPSLTYCPMCRQEIRATVRTFLS